MESREPPSEPSSGLMVGPTSYSANMATNNNNNNDSMTSPNSSGVIHNSRFPFNTMITNSSKPVDSFNYGDGSSSLMPSHGFSIEQAKKKRGRPRKYASDGNIALGLAPTISPVNHQSSDNAPSSEPQPKRNRGRPPGSGKKQLDALGGSGVGFTPHVIMVKAGEDIASKILAFSQQGPRTVIILSANGAISNVTLRQATISGGTVTYEGRFEIISLSGSVWLSESGGNRNRSCVLCVSLAGPDGRVLGGGVAGMLVAATPVQVIVGSFIADGKKPKPKKLTSPSSAPSSAPVTNMLSFAGAPVGAASPSQGGSTDSSDENGSSPFDRTSGPPSYGNAGQPIHSIPIYTSMGWTNNSAIKMLPN